MKVKGLADSLGSIGASVNNEDLVSIILNGVGRGYVQYLTSIGVCEVEEEAVLVAVHEIKTNSNSNSNSKTSPMEEDEVTLEAGGAKEDMVHGKGSSR